ncbi:MAG: hypothetical protein J0H98_11240 [Solirubrobacterales bacterium]|nr:hypothetical protein [Solirubrobacterales bacterium]
MKQALVLVAIGLASIAAFGSAQAQADVYCAELPGEASCTQNFTGTSTSIQDAVSAADDHAGPDTVKVGPGNFVMPSPVYLSNFGDENKLTLIGSGDSTVLSGSDPQDPQIRFEGGIGSSISDLSVSIADDTSNTQKIGLVLGFGAPVGDNLNVHFASESPLGDKTVGVRLQDGATLKNSNVRLYNSKVNSAVVAYGSANVLNSTLTAFRGVENGPTGTVEVKNSALIVLAGVGGLNLGGTMNIRDSVIVNPFGGDGVYLRSSGAPADMLVDGTTMVGTTPDGFPTSVGAVVLSAGTPDPGNVHFQVDNSVVYGYDYAIAYNVFSPDDVLNLDVGSSAYDSTRVTSYPGAGTPQMEIANPVDLNGVDPKFADPGAGDFSLAAGSPLIDAGQAKVPDPGSLALDGNPRACDGDDDGAIRRDIGAYELKTDPNDDCTYPDTSIADGPEAYPPAMYTSETAQFDLASTKAGSTFICSIDDAPYATCASPYTTPKLAEGPHTFRAKAVDSHGNIDQSPVERVVYLGAKKGHPPTCEEDPSLCPEPDRTAPKVLGLKSPKKTRAARAKVRFRSNEKGATFTCRLNRGKARKCRSPWKTPRLKKGRNVIRIQARDKVGNRSKVVRRVIRRV